MELNQSNNNTNNIDTEIKTIKTIKNRYILWFTIATILIIIIIFYLFNSNNNKLNNKFTIDNSKITWEKISPNISSNEDPNGESVSVSAMCVEGFQCNDLIIEKADVSNYKMCTYDAQCSYFDGFTGINSENETKSNTVMPVSRNSSINTENPNSINPNSQPKQVSGSSDCFNKEELLKVANKDNLIEDKNTACECSIIIPNDYKSGTISSVDANTGDTNPGTVTIIKGKVDKTWSCARPQNLPDILTENFIYPNTIELNNKYNISFDYKNVGKALCEEIYFQADITNNNKYLGGVGTHLLFDKPLDFGEIGKFNYNNKSLIEFEEKGDYFISISAQCELPRESHIVNGVKDINIRVK